ncbi:MAG TPA: hypothetical protein VFU86_21650 [Terriglobales bacterium]|nr:hypothetical protein [Terriglobales bacterium]
MENNERDRKLDQWLDEALSEYSAAEPRFGLEQRVLNRVRSEERRSRKWTFWRWMPALGAIAAVIVVAVAIRPVMEKKAPVRHANSPIDTYSRSAGDTANNSETKLLSRKAEGATKPGNHSELNASLRGAPTTSLGQHVARQKKNSPEGGDHDRLAGSQGTQADGLLAATPPDARKELGSGNGVARGDSARTVASLPPPPPPPGLQLKQAAPGATAGSVAGNAPSTPTEDASLDTNRTAPPKSAAKTAGAQVGPPALLADKVATESVTAIAKDSRRKEAHAKPGFGGADTNTFVDASGVTVRFNSGIGTQQFPTPVPLSTQERLALKAGQQLKDSAVAQHKSTEIAPIEIKDVEIKPLEGPEK